MNFNITGKIEKIFPEQNITPSFKKRELVLNVQDENNNTQYILFVIFNNKTNILDKFSEGDEVIINFKIQGKKWISPHGKEKYINNLVIETIEYRSNLIELPEKILKEPSDNDPFEDLNDLPF